MYVCIETRCLHIHTSCIRTSTDGNAFTGVIIVHNIKLTLYLHLDHLATIIRVYSDVRIAGGLLGEEKNCWSVF